VPPTTIEAWKSRYLAVDGLGSTAALVSVNGVQAGAYTYDPYGTTTATALNGSSAIYAQSYGYAGGIRYVNGWSDTGETLMHYGMRWYDPTTGRFTQQDSLETLADPTRSNRYEYAASNPANYVDPVGLSPSCTAQGLGGALTGGLFGGAIGLLGGPVGAARGAAIGSAAYGTYASERCSGESVGSAALSGGLAAVGGAILGFGGAKVLSGLTRLFG
jgi:RHS repeat-associated protein